MSYSKKAVISCNAKIGYLFAGTKYNFVQHLHLLPDHCDSSETFLGAYLATKCMCFTYSAFSETFEEQTHMIVDGLPEDSSSSGSGFYSKYFKATCDSWNTLPSCSLIPIV